MCVTNQPSLLSSAEHARCQGGQRFQLGRDFNSRLVPQKDWRSGCLQLAAEAWRDEAQGISSSLAGLAIYSGSLSGVPVPYSGPEHLLVIIVATVVMHHQLARLTASYTCPHSVIHCLNPTYYKHNPSTCIPEGC